MHFATRIFILLLTVLMTACSHQQQPGTAPSASVRKLVWSDEFDYTGLPDANKWGYEEGFVRNNEPQYYTKARLQNCRVENGYLVIEAHKENWVNPRYVRGSSTAAEKDSLVRYTSASINTLGHQTWQFGRIEVRARLPKGKGAWPAIWMMGENRAQLGWPRCGEIDIMEFLGKDPSTVYATVHFPDTTAAGRGSKGGKLTIPDPSLDFHIYAMEWNTDKIDFYFDNQLYFSFPCRLANHTGMDPFRKKNYLLLNLALGHEGSWPGPTDDAILPARYYVDYVRVYQ